MIGLFLPVARIMWHSGMHEQESDSVASLNIKILCEKQLSTYKWRFFCNQAFDQFVNVFRNWRPVERAKGNLKRIMYEIRTHKKERERNLQRILIVFHAVLASFRETTRYQHLSLLHCLAFWCCNQGVEEVQEHAPPSACLKTTVSLRPRKQIRTRKR